MAERDESEDSRTTGVGRKRNFQESSSDTVLADDSLEGVRKRVKAEIEDVLVTNASSNSSLEPSTSPLKNNIVENISCIDAPENDMLQKSYIKKSTKPSITWNTSIHSGLGLRTSFGSKPVAEAPALNSIIKENELQTIDVNVQLHSTTNQVPSPAQSDRDSAVGQISHPKRDTSLTESAFDSSSEDEVQEIEKNGESLTTLGTQPWLDSGIFRMLDAKVVSGLPKNQRRMYRQAHRAYLKQSKLATNTALVDSLIAQDQTWPVKDEKIASMVSTGKTFYPRVPTSPLKFRSLNLPGIILHNGLPIKGFDFSYETYAISFLTENMDGLDKISSKVVQQSFKYYVQSYYSHIGSFAFQMLTGKSKDSLNINDTRRRVKLLAQQKQDVEISGREDFKITDQKMANFPDRSLEHVTTSKIPQPTSDTENILQEKYYPIASGGTQPCLTCAKTGHRWSECPAVSCDYCEAGQHSNLMCPRRKRCGKCHEQGHLISECSQKLFLAASERLPCEICGSGEHMEANCHYLWRTFDPRPEHILKVREIPIFCFCCGASGHYGTECGLNTKLLLTGSVTWSRTNLQRYVDPNSHARALSAGTDYSIPPKSFNIKGKANIPEVLEDDSEDAETFIRPKVLGLQSRPIRFRDNHRPTEKQYEGSMFDSIQASTFGGLSAEQNNYMHQPRTSLGSYQSQKHFPSIPARRDPHSSQNRGNEASQKGGLPRRGKKSRSRAAKQMR